MGLLDKIFGTDSARQRDDGRDAHGRTADPGGHVSPATGPRAPDQRGAGPDQDEVAVERYRNMLRTAPPETVEQAHAEAFAKLTPEQRRQVLTELSASTPEAERDAADDPQSLARTATRAEMREPGTMERTLGANRGAGMGMGGMLAGSLLASVAGAFIGTSIAGAFLDDPSQDASGDGAGEGEDSGGDMGGDGEMTGGDDPAGAEFGDAGMGDGGFDDVGGDLGI